MTAMKVASVTPCDCAAHATVHLRDDIGIERAEVKVDIGSAQAIAAQLYGVCGPDSCHSDLLEVCLGSQGARLEGVTLTEQRDGPYKAHLCIDGPRAARIRVPLGTALVVASKLSLPVRVNQAPTSEQTLPGAFLEAFPGEETDW